MNDHPTFERWDVNELAKYAHDAFDRIKDALATLGMGAKVQEVAT